MAHCRGPYCVLAPTRSTICTAPAVPPAGWTSDFPEWGLPACQPIGDQLHLTIGTAMGDTAPPERTEPTPATGQDLRGYRDVVVCAHPDDETFGLGAVITTLVEAGTRVRLVCFTHGESSTLGAGDDLAARRDGELACAAEVLGIEQVAVHAYPDGTLSQTPVGRLADEIVDAAEGADALLTFDQGGISVHPDHQQATAAAVAAGSRLAVPVLGWALPERVAATLRAEFGVPFVGRDDNQLHISLPVDRTRQHTAMACHGSQLTDSPVPHRRIELQGRTEHLRILQRPAAPDPHSDDHQEVAT